MDRVRLCPLHDQYEFSPLGSPLFKHLPGGHDDAVIAPALACWTTGWPVEWAAKAWKKLVIWYGE